MIFKLLQKKHFLMILVIISLTKLNAQEGEDAPRLIRSKEIFRESGDNIIKFNLGVFLPQFFYNPHDKTSQPTGLSLGPNLFFGYDYYLNDALRLGAVFSWDYATTVNQNNFNNIEFGIVTTYDIRFLYDYISMPVRLFVGANWPSYQDIFRTNLALKPGVSLLYNIDNDFAVGFNYDFSFNFEFPQIKAEERIAGFHHIGIGLEYAF